MLTIPNAVEEVVKNKPFLEGALIEGLINLSALARSIKSEVESRVGKDVTESAIVMALNRLVPKLEQTTRLKVQQIIDNMGDIIVRSSLTDYTFANSSALHSCQEKLLSHIDSLNPNKDIFCTVSQGINETTLVVSSQISDLVEEIFAQESIISRTESLSSITIKLPSENAFCTSSAKTTLQPPSVSLKVSRFSASASGTSMVMPTRIHNFLIVSPPVFSCDLSVWDGVR